MGRRVDLTGQRFGAWTVVGDSGDRSSSCEVMWACVCDCGETRTVRGSTLTKGISTSCGCGRLRERVGEKYGMLTFINYTTQVGSNHSMWKCICQCGNVVVVDGRAVASGNTKSCGCLRSRRGVENHRYNPNMTDEERLKNRYELSVGNSRIWSQTVFQRDNYTCKICGDNKGGNLNAHHLNGWNAFPEQRFDLDNGVTLCTDCHKEFHSQYGYGDNTREQFDEYAARKLRF